jgi:drug/metabolite transporter (DMT)-like permease
MMLATVVVLWGSSFTVLKLGLEEISPVTLAFLRFSLASPLFFASTCFQEKTLFVKSVFRDWKLLTALGLTGVTLYHSFQNVELRFTTASNSSLIISANPIFIALLDHFYLKTELTRKQVVGIVLAFSGSFLVIGPFRIIFHPAGVTGDLLSLGAALSWAFDFVLGKKMLSQYTAQEITTFSLVFGTLFLLPLLLLSEALSLPASLFSWVLLLLLSFLCSGVAYFLWYKALEDISATTAGVSLFFLPVVFMLFARLVLLEPIDIFFLTGSVFVMLGVLLTAKY